MGLVEHQRLFSTTLAQIARPGKGGASLMRQIGSIACCDAFAIRHADGRNGLELRIRGLSGGLEPPSMKGVITSSAMQDGLLRLAMHAAAPDVADLFTSLADDLVASVQPLDSPEQCCETLVMRLEQWQVFLSSCSPGGLGAERQAGLYAELLFLRDRLLPVVGVAQAVSAWKGGDKASHDFQYAGRAIEVKSSRREMLDSIVISSVVQLEIPEQSSLLLSVWHLQASEAGGETLPGLIEQLREDLPLASRTVLDEGLRRYGYLDTQEHLYGATGYTLRATRHYDVGEGFPRIRAAHLPEGVSKVRYRVELTAAGDFLLEEEAVSGALEAGATS